MLGFAASVFWFLLWVSLLEILSPQAGFFKPYVEVANAWWTINVSRRHEAQQLQTSIDPLGIQIAPASRENRKIISGLVCSGLAFLAARGAQFVRGHL